MSVRRSLRQPYLLIGLVAATYAWRAWDRRWISDDGFITLRVARNLALGHGLVYNPGERVEASTSTLWTLVLGVGGLLRGLIALEWTAVLLGIAFAVAGLALAQVGAARLHETRGRFILPLGALVVLAVSPFADFATSGLESGLVFLWLGATFWALVDARSKASVRWWVLVLIGLGPLVRPELAVFTAGFAVAAAVIDKPFAPRRAARFVACLAAVPVVYEVFRMAYFATLYPNPVLAKEGPGGRWEQGWRYVGDLGGPYRLWIPLVVAAVATIALLASRIRNRDGQTIAIIVAPVVCAIVQGLLIVRVGGDFMHGRLLLPSLFGVLLPVMAVPVSARALAAVIPVAAWAVVCGFAWRVPYDGIGPDAIADERSYYAGVTGWRHPVEVDTYVRTPSYQRGKAARDLARRGERQLVIAEERLPRVALPLRRDLPVPVVLRTLNIGVAGYIAGDDVWIADELGLADAIGSRTRVAIVGRPGHEKFLPSDWTIARFAAEPRGVPELGVLPESVEAATAVLRCDPLPRLLGAVSERLTPRRMAVNVVRSISFTRMRFPADAIRARDEVCADDRP